MFKIKKIKNKKKYIYKEILLFSTKTLWVSFDKDIK